METSNLVDKLIVASASPRITRAVESRDNGVSYPGLRSVGGAPRSLRVIFYRHLQRMQNVIFSERPLTSDDKKCLIRGEAACRGPRE